MAKRTNKATNANATTTAKSKKPQPPATAKSDERALADGRQVQAALKKNLAAIQKNDKGREEKLFPKALVDEMASLARVASTAVTARRLVAEKKRGAVAGADALLVELLDMVRTNRDVIEVTFASDRELQRGFGRGKRLKTADDALAISSLQQQTCEDKVLGPRAKKAGFGAAAVKLLIAKRRELVAATTGKAEMKGASKGQQLDKKDALRRLAALTARGRKVAKIVFKSQPKILAQFESKQPKRSRAKAATKTGAKSAAAQPSTSALPIAAPAPGSNGSTANGDAAARKLTVTATASE